MGRPQKVIKTVDGYFYHELGARIRKQRERLNMTQLEVSQEVGISRPQYINYEYGYTKMRQEMFERICRVLEMSSEISIELSIGGK